MIRRRTRYFKITFLSSLGFSAAFLAVLALFGAQLANANFQSVADSVFVLMALAAGSFLLFSFTPYFRGDKRWYSISALFTVVFFMGAVIVWQLPVAAGRGF
ncbi:MAG: hypothetical protein IJF33_03720 [Clostridia bacterium]|nr:hypothetical protein [Clostridia bacterium]